MAPIGAGWVGARGWTVSRGVPPRPGASGPGTHRENEGTKSAESAALTKDRRLTAWPNGARAACSHMTSFFMRSPTPAPTEHFNPVGAT